MIFRFTLSHPIVGSLEISEPDGWSTAVLKLDRHEEFHSLVEYFDGSFIFYGNNGIDNGGIDFIKEVDQIGVDEAIVILIEISLDDVNYRTVFTGQLKLADMEEMPDNKLRIPIIRDDFWAKFISRLDTPVNLLSELNLDGEPALPISPIVLRMTSQIIDAESTYAGHSGDFDTMDKAAVATTANITLSGNQTVNGVLTRTDMRVLVKNQTDQTENGVYNAGSGAWTRTTDANTDAELEAAIITVVQGSQAGTYKQQTTPVTIGVSNIVWATYNYVDDYELFNNSTSESLTVVDHDIYISATVEPVKKEIKDTFMIPVIGVITPDDVFNQIEITEGFGLLQINVNDIELSLNPEGSYVGAGIPLNRDYNLYLFVQKNSETPIQLDSSINNFPIPDVDPHTFNLSGSIDFNVRSGDLIKLYIRIIIDTHYDVDASTWIQRTLLGGIVSEDITLLYKSQKEDTYASGFLLHDVGACITDRIIGQDNTFYSELLGSSLTQARQYLQDGCAWAYGLFKGLQLRQYTLNEKPFFLSFMQWWKGINPILNLSLCYDIVDDEPVILTEEKEKQYDISTGTSANFSHVRAGRKYDNDKIYNKAEIGYVKWEPEEVSGIDDPQTKRTYFTRFKIIGKVITLFSEFIAASLSIEKTRRTTREKSADYKYDNETFIVALNPESEDPDTSPETLQFIPELDENFTSVTNLLNAETRYNLRLTPARNLLRWQNYLQGALQSYLSSSIKFASGEGNYDMASEMINATPGCLNEDFNGEELSEKGDIPVTDDFIHLPHLYDAEIPMEWEEYETIRDNRRKPIGISLTDENHVPMFIKTLEYKPVKGTASCLLWAKEYLDLSVIPDTTPMQECLPQSDECENALTDELGNILTDELGVCITS